MGRRGPVVRAAVVALVASLLTVAPSAERPADARLAQPVGVERGFADPAVVRHAGGYIAVSTGPLAPRATAPAPSGPWTSAGQTLARLPAWASSPSVWAADLVHAGDRWLLYYSATVRGLGRGGRCIGVAASRHVLGGYVPVGRRPLVCPRGARAPRGEDVVARTRGLRRERGVIDPSGFRDRDGRRYLVYKTQSAPSSIRLLRLTRGGAHAARRGRSHELLRRRGVTENPELVRRGRHVVLYTSEGYFGDCGYRTTWRRSRSLWRWERSPRHPLLHRSRQGICGPGGLDVLGQPGGPDLGWFHGWTCWRTDRPCPGGRDLERRRDLRPQRSLYAGEIRWRQGRPTVRLLRRAS